MKRASALLAVLLVTAILLPSLVAAQRAVSDDEVNAVAKKLYCPVCENTPLDVCPTQVCREWRELIRQQLSEGWTEEQVMDYFAATYGPQVLAQPPAQGFNVLVWILPLVGLVGGGVFLWRLLRRGQERRRARKGAEVRPTVHPAAAAGPDEDEGATEPLDIPPEVLERIEREVEARF